MNAPQRSGAWFAARTGKLTASRMADAMSFLKNGKESQARYDLKVELLAERLTGNIVPHFTTPAMQWGIDTEPQAVSAYEDATGRIAAHCGFYEHATIPDFGASPDRTLGPNCGLEVKCFTTARHTKILLSGVIPDECKPQLLAQIACTGWEWIDWVSFDPRLPEKQRLFVRRFQPTREEVEVVEEAARQFLAELDAMWEQLTTQEMIA